MLVEHLIVILVRTLKNGFGQLIDLAAVGGIGRQWSILASGDRQTRRWPSRGEEQNERGNPLEVTWHDLISWGWLD
jgi:hypothetical protein